MNKKVEEIVEMRTGVPIEQIRNAPLDYSPRGMGVSTSGHHATILEPVDEHWYDPFFHEHPTVGRVWGVAWKVGLIAGLLVEGYYSSGG